MNWHRVKYALDYFFWTIFRGGSTPLVLREGWDEVYQYWGRGGGRCHYSGRGERRTITTQGGVAGCNNKHYWLMKLLLDRTNDFNRFFDWHFVCQNFSAGPRRSLIFLSCGMELKHYDTIWRPYRWQGAKMTMGSRLGWSRANHKIYLNF